MDRRLIVLALGMFALGTDSFVVAGVLPEISRTFSVSIGAAGQMTTAYAITYALMAPLIAAVAAHVPRKRMLLSALAIFGVANLITAVAPNFAVAMASRVLAGIGAAMFAPTATGAAATLVSAERRGQALSIVIAGLTVATALGTPIGAVIGGLGDWRWTMAFVSILAGASAVGVWRLLAHVPLPPKITLAQRIKPVADPRISLTLLCTWLYQSGHFIIYTYFTVVFDRAIGHSALLTGVLLVIWGTSGTASNLIVGRLADSIGDRKLIFNMLVVLMLVVATVSWTGASLWTTVPALIVYGAFSWGLLAPQQRRLVAIAPQTAPVVLGLNTSCTYLGVTTAGVIGALGLPVFGAHHLGYLGAVLVAISLAVAELASWRIAVATAPEPIDELASA
ncbi:MAG: MFS transporter [Candidatus Eremiobacteraeota bacterium]|nr:MFS transporter [Candidatus Eremiobacteraeota bacterium]MBV8572643.1 MFS transporter [Acidobacteriaceae bacterium]